MKRYRLVLGMFGLMAAGTAFAGYEWMMIDSGTIMGSGFDMDRSTAIAECASDLEAQFIAAAQACCDSTENDTTARFGNRCAGGYSGDENHRSFSGGVAAYFCWPGNSETQFPTGYWYVQSDPRDWTCKELMDMMPDPVETPEETTELGDPADYADGLDTGAYEYDTGAY
jgi:hypothetical protein